MVKCLIPGQIFDYWSNLRPLLKKPLVSFAERGFASVLILWPTGRSPWQDEPAAALGPLGGADIEAKSLTFDIEGLVFDIVHTSISGIFASISKLATALAPFRSVLTTGQIHSFRTRVLLHGGTRW